jgi:hypothetical protein
VNQDPPVWTPDLSDVAAELMARTRLPNGELAGTFTSETEPTNEQATKAIDKAVTLLKPALGEVPDRLVDQAQSLATLRAACIIERSYFPEQVETNVSPFRQIWAEYKEGLKLWEEAARGEEPNSPGKQAALRIGTDYPGYATGTY